MSSRLAILAVLHGALGACAPREAAQVTTSWSDVLVSVRAGAVLAQDSVEAGWARVRVEEDGARHILVVFRLPEAATDGDVTAFLAALDTARR